MIIRRPLLAAFLAAAAVWPLAAQGAKTYKARLTPLPHTVQMLETLAGQGSVTATLNGRTLTITGTFDGLPSAATAAHLHRGQPGVPGPKVADLKVSNATSGTISGTVELTASQVQDLDKHWLYVQLHSEKAPEGHLRGWLFQEKQR
jgi:CHRD domain